MSRRFPTALTAVAVLVFCISDAHAGFRTVRLTEPAPSSGGQFGFAVAAAGGNVVVGAPGANQDAGAAYLFNGITGALVRQLNPPTANPGDHFGFSVSAAGDGILVGAPGVGGNVGRVYLFDASNGAVLRTYTIQVSDPSVGLFYGAAVSSIDERALIGAPGHTENVSEEAGIAYLYPANPAATPRTFLRVPLHPRVRFGETLLGFGSRVVVGVPRDNLGPNDGGAVYVYDAETGARQLTIQQPAPKVDDFFGTSLAIHGANLLVGMPRRPNLSPGRVYLYDLAASSAPVQTFFRPNGVERDDFGASVAASGLEVLVGAPLADGAFSDTGEAFLFRPDATLIESFVPPTPAAEDHFGYAVAGVGKHLVIGAPCEDTALSNVSGFVPEEPCKGSPGSNAGSAYLILRVNPDDPCDDANDCTTDAPVSDVECGNTPVADCCTTSTDCIGADACHTAERCEQNACAPRTVLYDDGLRCTIDCTLDQGALSPPQSIPGYDGLRCWLEELGSAVARGRGSIAGKKLPKRIVKLASGARAQVEAMQTARPRKQRKGIVRTGRKLTALQRIVAKAVKRKKMPSALAAELRSDALGAQLLLPSIEASIK